MFQNPPRVSSSQMLSAPPRNRPLTRKLSVLLFNVEFAVT